MHASVRASRGASSTPPTQEHGLATTGGRVSTTGVAGFTLGGGSGWLERKHGLACDNLLAVDLVTADGREVTASEDENPELFWGLRGGGGNFGVATTLTFRLHRVGPEVLAGLLMWPGDVGLDVGRVYRDLGFSAPDELGSAMVFLTGPPEEFVPAHLQGTTVAAVAVLWTRRRRRRRGGHPAAARPAARGRPRGTDAVRRPAVHARRPARPPELLDGRLPRLLPR